jgi:hypothetical protein
VVTEVKALQSLIERFSTLQAEVELKAGQIEIAERPRLVAIEGGKAVSAPTGEDLRPTEDQEVLRIVQEALRLDRPDVYLHPIVSLPQRRNRYYECYTRIRAEDGHVIGPGQHIGVAEREGLVSSIDNMLLFCCVQLVRRTQRRNYDTAFFCNISRESLADTSLSVISSILLQRTRVLHRSCSLNLPGPILNLRPRSRLGTWRGSLILASASPLTRSLISNSICRDFRLRISVS